MEKFGLNYRLKVGLENGDFVIIEPPFTLQFNIIRNTNAQVNAAQFRIINLSPTTRDALRYNISTFAKIIPVELYAGYGNKLARCFRGSIMIADSFREGVDYLTQIECFDGGQAYINSRTSQSFSKGTPFKEVITKIAGDLVDTEVGGIGDFKGILKRSNSYQGSSVEILRDLTGNNFFIDNGKAHALFSNEYLDTGSILEISPSTGLLNTPIFEQSIVRFETLFEPQLNVGVRIKLDAFTNRNYNGLYKCTSVHHKGVISESVASSVTTMGTFFYTKFLSGVETFT